MSPIMIVNGKTTHLYRLGTQRWKGPSRCSWGSDVVVDVHQPFHREHWPQILWF